MYAVAGDVLDTVSRLNLFNCNLINAIYFIIHLFQYLYDLLMNYLEEKGITNEFADKLVGLSTSYEHASYISLLESLSKFASGK